MDTAGPRKTHKITKTEVIEKDGTYGVSFEFDDGYTDYAELPDRETAEFYARVQRGETLPIGVNPLLLSAEKAETLRHNGSS
jgi:hypothetical protein